MTQNNNTQPAPDPQPLTPDLPEPNTGMSIKVITFDAKTGESSSDGPYTIAAVSANGKVIWTRGGKAIHLDEPGKRIVLYWPDLGLAEPIVPMPQDENNWEQGGYYAQNHPSDREVAA